MAQIEDENYDMSGDVWWENTVGQLKVHTYAMIADPVLQIVTSSRLFRQLHPDTIIFAKSGQFGDAYKQFFDQDYPLPDGLIPALLDGELRTIDDVNKRLLNYKKSLQEVLGVVDSTVECPDYVRDLQYIQQQIEDAINANCV
jgi:hypothetical protein